MISLIIPMYNAEETIERCVNSIKNQTYKDWEAIIIDDASTDMSALILDSLIKDDSRFRMFKMDKNSGPAAARNLGLKEAQGEWISFVDSDDEIDKECLLDSLNVAEEDNADIVMWGIVNLRENEVESYQKTFCEKKVFTKNEIDKVIKILYTHECDDGSNGLNVTGPVAKLISASLAKSYEFPENINYAEDVCYIRQLLDACNKFVYFDEVLYYRHIRINSLSYSMMINDWKRQTNYINWLMRYEKQNAKVKVEINFDQIQYNCLKNFIILNVHIISKKPARNVVDVLTYNINFSNVKDRWAFMVKCMENRWYYLYKVLVVVCVKMDKCSKKRKV